MALEERYGNRNGEFAYSQWHRPESIARFMGTNLANSLSMINLDHPATIWLEYNHLGQTVALIEGALLSANYKPYKVTRNLAEQAGIMAFVVLYILSDEANPKSRYDCKDISYFQVKEVYPNEWSEFRPYTPEGYAQFLLALRDCSLDKIAKKQDGILGEIKDLLIDLHDRLSSLELMVGA